MTLDPRKKMAADLGDSRHPAAKLPVARSALLHSLSFLVILLASRDRRNNLPAIQPSHTRSCGDNVATRIDGEIESRRLSKINNRYDYSRFVFQYNTWHC